MDLSVIIPTHNPHAGRLSRTLLGLRAQDLAVDRWETVLVDNASAPAIDLTAFARVAPSNFRCVREPQLGLSAARRRGFSESRAPLCLLVDDDNLLASDYLSHVVHLFDTHPRLGALGGRSLPEFENPPPPWAAEFFPLLALRDCGPAPLTCGLQRAPADAHYLFPAWAPIGAGMALRRQAAMAWAEHAAATPLPDRQGSALTSGGDNDIVLTVLHAGWEVGYFPELELTHLIPATRLEPAYLARLNRGIQTSWIQVLERHSANPWPLVPRWTVPLRQFKAWFAFRAWTGHVARIRWQGACGHFAGRARPPAP